MKGERLFIYSYIIYIVVFLILLYNKKPFEVFNIGNSHETTILTLAKIIFEKYSLSTSNIVILNKNNVQRYDVTRRVPSLLKSKREIGYSPTVQLEEGIKKIIAND